MICFQQRDWGIDMIPLQWVLFGAAAGFWLAPAAEVDYNCLRVFYVMGYNERVVRMPTTGAKSCDRLPIVGQKFEPRELPRIIDGLVPRTERHFPHRG